MLIRVFLVMLATATLSGQAVGQEKFSGFLHGGLQFGPAEEESDTIDVSAKLIQLDAQTVELQVTVTPTP